MSAGQVDGDCPAFPCELRRYVLDRTLDVKYGGMSLRAYFAGLAMQGFCISEREWGPAQTAEQSVAMADALIEELQAPSD